MTSHLWLMMWCSLASSAGAAVGVWLDRWARKRRERLALIALNRQIDEARRGKVTPAELAARS
jgi:membrane protein YqaA with SNARE-associated domain